MPDYPAHCVEAAECRPVEECMGAGGWLGFVLDGRCVEIDWSKLSPYAVDDHRHVCLRGDEQVCVIGPIMDVSDEEEAGNAG